MSGRSIEMHVIRGARRSSHSHSIEVLVIRADFSPYDMHFDPMTSTGPHNTAENRHFDGMTGSPTLPPCSSTGPSPSMRSRWRRSGSWPPPEEPTAAGPTRVWASGTYGGSWAHEPGAADRRVAPGHAAGPGGPRVTGAVLPGGAVHGWRGSRRAARQGRGGRAGRRPRLGCGADRRAGRPTRAALYGRGLVSTTAGGMRLADYVPTRTLELVVHTCDLASARREAATRSRIPLGRAAGQSGSDRVRAECNAVHGH